MGYENHNRPTLDIDRLDIFYGKTGTEWAEKVIKKLATSENMKHCLKDKLLKDADKKFKKAKEDLKELKEKARYVPLSLSEAGIVNGRAELEFETRYPLSWEYDRDRSSRSEWEKEGDGYIQADLKKLHKVFPKKLMRFRPVGCKKRDTYSFTCQKNRSYHEL